MENVNRFFRKILYFFCRNTIQTFTLTSKLIWMILRILMKIITKPNYIPTRLKSFRFFISISQKFKSFAVFSCFQITHFFLNCVFETLSYQFYFFNIIRHFHDFYGFSFQPSSLFWCFDFFFHFLFSVF